MVMMANQLLYFLTDVLDEEGLKLIALADKYQRNINYQAIDLEHYTSIWVKSRGGKAGGWGRGKCHSMLALVAAAGYEIRARGRGGQDIDEPEHNG